MNQLDTKINKKFNNQVGFTLVEVALGLAGIAFLSVAVMTVALSSNSYLQSSEEMACLLQVKTSFIDTISRDSAWKNTMLDADNVAGPFACFPNGAGFPTSCPLSFSAATQFVLRDGWQGISTGVTPGNVMFDILHNPTYGFRNDCTPCTSGAPSAQCPIVLTLTYGTSATRDAVPAVGPGAIDPMAGKYAPVVVLPGQIVVWGSFTGGNLGGTQSSLMSNFHRQYKFGAIRILCF